MFFCKVQDHRLLAIVSVIVSLLFWDTVLAAPKLLVSASVGRAEREESNGGPMSGMTSRALGAFVRVASYIWQWLPELPRWMKPSKPTLRVAKNSNVRVQDLPDSFEDMSFG